jgi:hypothetical protein
MKITVIAEHSVDLELLPEKANILDLGCRGFLFADEMSRLGHRVVPVDCDILIVDRPYSNLAITNHNGYTFIHRDKDPQATKVSRVGFEKVDCMTLSSFSEECNVKFWDIIKIDIEGSEYEVIMSLTEPPAKQLSIEFHLHTGVYGIKEMAEMRDKLTELGYEAVSHEMTKQHGLGLNFWDSLFILK